MPLPWVKAAQRAAEVGFDQMLVDQAAAWKELWREADITIEGDVAAQQAIRFNIFQLYQTYTGEDDRLNIGPKGFTGEKYGGSTYWDTEAYCVPFYLNTRKPEVVRQLLVYRYKHLGKAIENAEKLGFTGGAAHYGDHEREECHNEWEITFGRFTATVPLPMPSSTTSATPATATTWPNTALTCCWASPVSGPNA